MDLIQWRQWNSENFEQIYEFSICVGTLEDTKEE